jgi:DNA-directed RNA polymerase specialized sigma24 family protein
MLSTSVTPSYARNVRLRACKRRRRRSHDRPDLRPLRAVEQHRLASQAAESAIELARCLRGLPTAEAAFAAYE